ncbi:hypothetical protein [Thiosulfativibrio zosterae]|nr:hypothetical protein [Thiosulfativibrio zosterae]
MVTEWVNNHVNASGGLVLPDEVRALDDAARSKIIEKIVEYAH